MKYLLSILTILCFQFTFAQLAISNLEDGTPINDGDSFDFETIVFEDAKLEFVISNSSTTETITVLAEMVSFTNSNGSNLQFCVFPECYFDVSPGDTIPTEPIVLEPGEDNGTFDYFSNTNPGDGENYPMTYTIRFFMLDGEGNETGEDITITYNYTPENFSTTNYSLEDMGIALQSTVIAESLSFRTNDKISLTAYDISGKKVKNYSANAGQHRVSLDNLSSGNYILIFEDNLNRQVQVRIQKK